jgi:hypothetical protein
MRVVVAVLLIWAATLAPAMDIRGAVDQHGTVFDLTARGESRLVAVTFLGVDCPLGGLYMNRLRELHAQFAPRGVCFVVVDSNQQDTFDEVVEFAGDAPFPVLKDKGFVVADEFGATRSPEVFLLDENRDVIYRGRIDDQYAPGMHSQEKPRRAHLEAAISEALASQPISVPSTEPIGCHIDRVEPTAGKPAANSPTYSKDIAPILDAKCVRCHRPGEVAPFSLASFADTLGWAGTIGEVVTERRMPPWGADEGSYANDPSLTEQERSLILDWVQAGAPEGDPALRPQPPTFPDGWSIKPDQIFTGPEFTVPKEGVLELQELVIDPGLHEDAWVSAIEVRPSCRAVVHHATVLLKPKDAEPGLFYFDKLFDNYLALYVPGNSVTSFPQGFAKRIPAGWNLVLQVHFVPNGTQQTDQIRVGVVFADSPEVQVATRMAESPVNLQPQEVKTAVAEFTLDDDYHLIALYPHMHLRGRSMLFEALFPDGRRETLLNVPDYDFEWQHRYVLKEPRPLPSGTRLRCTSLFDNSAANKRNPDPTAFVKYGTATTDEMFFGAFELGRPIERAGNTLAYAWCAVAVGALIVLGKRIVNTGKSCRVENAGEPR